MRGFVPTAASVVDQMVADLFADLPPTPDSRVLDPGCGQGAFIEGVIRWCRKRGLTIPFIAGVESDPRHWRSAKQKFGADPKVTILRQDFLRSEAGEFDYVLGNPPYVPITHLSEPEKRYYRSKFQTARGRFDLYILFLEAALRALRPGGKLVFITPEKFLYVEGCAELRRILAGLDIQKIQLVHEQTFGNLITYPTITVIRNQPSLGQTRVILRNGTTRSVSLAGDGRSWLPGISGAHDESSGPVLADICERVTCGVATGADKVFVVKGDDVPRPLDRFAFPTISGREIGLERQICTNHSMLIPYDRNGNLIPISDLGTLRGYLSDSNRRQILRSRTCARRKPWYAFHETPRLDQILRPKILCKDITPCPFFIVDEAGKIVPRHSVYYIIPRNPAALRPLHRYLNSDDVRQWLTTRCQRAANGYLRLQSHVLQRLPVPPHLVPVPKNGSRAAREAPEA